jgi:hypothetical protein
VPSKWLGQAGSALAAHIVSDYGRYKALVGLNNLLVQLDTATVEGDDDRRFLRRALAATDPAVFQVRKNK